jgi:hypothetical protein
VTHVSRDIRVEGRSARTLAPRPLLIGLSDLKTGGFLRLVFFSPLGQLCCNSASLSGDPRNLSASLQLEVSLRDPSSRIICFLLHFGFPVRF